LIDVVVQGVPSSSSQHAIDALSELAPSFVVNLFPGGFSIEGQNEAFPYDRTYKEFLQSLDRGLLPADTLMDLPGQVDFKYYEGCLLVELRDHRLPRQHDLRPSVHRLLLHPDIQTVTNDIRNVWRQFQNLSPDDILLVEKQLLIAQQPKLCLDPDPHVGITLSLLHRRANRLAVPHRRPPRPSVSDLRRPFDSEALRRMQAAVHAFNRDPNALQKLEKLAKSRAMKSSGISAFHRDQLQWEEADKPGSISATATILRLFHRSAPQTTSSHGAAPSPQARKPPPLAQRPPGSAEVKCAPNAFLPTRLLRPNALPERQLRFRRDTHIVSIWIQKKSPSSFQVWTRIDEVGKEGKPIEGMSTNVTPHPIGNSESAKLYGAQLYSLLLREGWTCVQDSHSARKPNPGAAGAAGAAQPSNPSSGAAGGAQVTWPPPLLPRLRHQYPLRLRIP